jgi:hypothetical protein
MKVLILALVLAAAPFAHAQPAQIILIRHGEKPADPEAVHLSKEGQERARALVHFVTTTPELKEHGLPAALFATQTTKHGRGQRTQETIAPLAKELGLPIQTPVGSEEYKAMAKAVLSNHKLRGKTILICWTHEFIPELAAALGVRPQPPKWKDENYDGVYLISYEPGGVKLQELTQPFSPGAKEPKKHKH